MRKLTILIIFSILSVIVFASFPVNMQELVLGVEPEKFKLDTGGFILGILTWWLLPYAAFLLFIKKSNFRGSLAWGWLTGLVLFMLIIIVIFASIEGPFFLY